MESGQGVITIYYQTYGGLVNPPCDIHLILLFIVLGKAYIVIFLCSFFLFASQTKRKNEQIKKVKCSLKNKLKIIFFFHVHFFLFFATKRERNEPYPKGHPDSYGSYLAYDSSKKEKRTLIKRDFKIQQRKFPFTHKMLFSVR